MSHAAPTEAQKKNFKHLPQTADLAERRELSEPFYVLTDRSYGSNEPTTISALSATQKDAIRDALGLWSELADVTFVEVAETGGHVGVMRFGSAGFSRGRDGALASARFSPVPALRPRHLSSAAGIPAVCRTRRAMRLPAVRAGVRFSVDGGVVETRGLEPLTSAMRTLRSPR